MYFDKSFYLLQIIEKSGKNLWLSNNSLNVYKSIEKTNNKVF